ncbi:MAG: hypothetical protein AAF570_16120, partial [Bacteroidota bacterium]
MAKLFMIQKHQNNQFRLRMPKTTGQNHPIDNSKKPIDNDVWRAGSVRLARSIVASNRVERAIAPVRTECREHQP